MKQVRQSRMRKRMMANVPKAAVVITNPTHYSIALQYERGMEAPICVAKGIDAVAMKIRACPTVMTSITEITVAAPVTEPMTLDTTTS